MFLNGELELLLPEDDTPTAAEPVMAMPDVMVIAFAGGYMLLRGDRN